MSVRTYLVVVIILLCIAVVNNVVMYTKCYVNNDIDDPFIPENIGVYRVNVYYNKYRYPDPGVKDEILPFVTPMRDSTFGRYVITIGKPTSNEYQQISRLGNYQA
jgi:hypothetical protein